MKNLLMTSIFMHLAPAYLYAQDAAGQATPPQGGGLMGILPLFAIVFVIFYFIVIRPQDKEQRAHQSMMESLKAGTRVLTTGGLVAKVHAIEEEDVVLEIANNVRARYRKNSILQTVETSDSESKGKKKNGK